MGTFVGIKLDDQSVRRLHRWCKENGIKHPLVNDDYHVTLLYSDKKTFEYKPKRYYPKLYVNPNSYSIKLLGPDNDVLALTFECSELERYHRSLRSTFSLNWNFEKYQPHVTLSKKDKIPKGGISPPDFPLYLTHEYTETFKK